MDVYEMINNRIIESLEKGVAPWKCPWLKGEHDEPRNFVSTKKYNGINPFLLGMTAIAKGYSSPFWLTYRQAQSLGGNVKQGEKSPAFVVFYKQIEKKDKDEGRQEGETSSRDDFYRMLRYTPVFNTDQCDGLSVPDLHPERKKYEHEVIASAQAIVDAMPMRPTIESERQSNRAFYSPSSDKVVVPYLAQYEHAEEYYSTLFHELGHSTGAAHRLDRDFKNSVSFADHEYSKEELVAEFTASYLCGIAGIEHRTLDNSAAYLESWTKRLKDKANKKWLTWAASKASKAADFIRGVDVMEQKKAA